MTNPFAGDVGPGGSDGEILFDLRDLATGREVDSLHEPILAFWDTTGDVIETLVVGDPPTVWPGRWVATGKDLDWRRKKSIEFYSMDLYAASPLDLDLPEWLVRACHAAGRPVPKRKK